jgi:hypothetical protein
LAVELFKGVKQQVLQSISVRDAGDWPGLACAKPLAFAVWIEDEVSFDAGVWTLERIGLYCA